MSKLNFVPLPADQVRHLQNGYPDADGNAPERHISDGNGNACRFCLAEIAEGEEFLIVAHRPFSTRQPYSEQGPIFLHAKECLVYEDMQNLPHMYQQRESLLLRGYDENERIVYGTGQTVPPEQIEITARKILATKEVRFVHARSATNNCYQFRIEPKHEE